MINGKRKNKVITITICGDKLVYPEEKRIELLTEYLTKYNEAEGTLKIRYKNIYEGLRCFLNNICDTVKY